VTLRGYSAVLEDSRGDAGSSTQIHPKSAAANHQPREAELPPEKRKKPTRPVWQVGDGSGLRPSSVAARQALTAVTKATVDVDQQLALIEMLIAVGPEVREQGTLDESLRALRRLEDELGRSMADLFRTCRDIRTVGTSD
jgi:hypothetical protein